MASSVKVTNAVPDAREKKVLGAYFTPPVIAEFLTNWAIGGRAQARILDPSCGDGVFLRSAYNEIRRLRGSTRHRTSIGSHVFGVDVDADSLEAARRNLGRAAAAVTLVERDFLSLLPPEDLFGDLPHFDAVVGNPPFVRYQDHTGDFRRRSQLAALRQGVRLNGLASSWAGLLIHAASFLSPEGRLAMVLPAELLTVGYAEPVRKWLRTRFGAVRLVMFEKLQFTDALEDVVLLLANGSGGCDAFSLYYVAEGQELADFRPFSERPVSLTGNGKWTDILLPTAQRQLFNATVERHFVGLDTYGRPELGTVTGANSFFALSEPARQAWKLEPDRHVIPLCPPGTKHFSGQTFTEQDWREQQRAGAPVWLLHPDPDDRSAALLRYLKHGRDQRVHLGYKCRMRTPWWRPPSAPPPDFFFTYMSHRFPRIIANSARVTFVNSMHGINIRDSAPPAARRLLPYLALNTVTMLGAEIRGRFYGGGILKMEPGEAAALPIPSPAALIEVSRKLHAKSETLEDLLRSGQWQAVVSWVDAAVLGDILGITPGELHELKSACSTLRNRRMGRADGN